MSLSAGLRLRDTRLVKGRRRIIIRDLHATLDHKFTLCVGQSRNVISRLLKRRYMDPLLWRIVPPGEATNSYTAPKPGGDIAHSFGVGILSRQVKIVEQIAKNFEHKPGFLVDRIPSVRKRN
jgi:hypothetical protein